MEARLKECRCCCMPVVMSVGTVALCALILELLQVPADIFSQAYSYLAIIFAGIPCTILYNYLSSILRAIGDKISS